MFRASQVRASLVWGSGYLCEFLVKVVLAFGVRLSIDVMNTVGPIMFAVMLVALIRWQIADAARGRRDRLAARKAAALQTVAVDEEQYRPPGYKQMQSVE